MFYTPQTKQKNMCFSKLIPTAHHYLFMEKRTPSPKPSSSIYPCGKPPWGENPQPFIIDFNPTQVIYVPFSLYSVIETQ